MKLSRWTIPTAFQVLDSVVTAADSFVDCRTLKVREQNHNVLLAKGVRKLIMTQAFAPLDVKAYEWGNDRDPPLAFEIPVLVNQGCQFLTVNVRCCKTDLASGTPGTPKLLFVLHPVGRKLQPDTYGVSFSVTTAYTATEASLGDYTNDIPVPMTGPTESWRAGRRVFMLACFCKSALVTDASGTAAGAITDVGSDHVKFAGEGAAAVGRVLHFSDLSLEPRQITRYDAGSGHYTVHPPLLQAAISGTDTATTRDVVGVRIHNISIYEKTVTDLTAVHGKV